MGAVVNNVGEKAEEKHHNEEENMEDNDDIVDETTPEDAKKKKKKKKKKKAAGGEGSVNVPDGGDAAVANTADALAKASINGDGDDEDEEGGAEDGAAKKKKKNRKKKKGGAGGGTATAQTNPPTVPIVDLYPSGNFPIGEECEYKINQDDKTAINRFTSAEKKALEISYDDMYKEIRAGAEVHRTTRKYF